MADSQQGVRQQSARDTASTTEHYNGDLRALFNSVATVPAGSTFNEAFMLWLQSVTGSSADNINDLAALFASQQTDTYNWSSAGSLGGPDPTITFTWDTENDQALPGGTTFTRASVKQEFDGSAFSQLSSGTIPENSAAVGGGAQGFFPEPAATNLQTESTDFDTTWGTLGTGVRTDLGAQSIGLNGYDLDAGVGTSAFHGINKVTNVTASATVSVYIIAKDIDAQFFECRINASSSTTYVWANYDLTNGLAQGNAATDSVSIEDLNNGFYKCNAIYTLSGAEFDPNQVIQPSDTLTPQPQTTGSGNTFTTAGESVVLLHHQVEETNYSTSPIITSGGTAARVADVLDMGVAVTTAFSAFLDVTLPIVIGTGNTITLLGPDTTAVDILRVNAGGDVIMDDGGTPVTIGTATLGTRITVAYGRDGSGRSGSLDGATAVTGGAPGAGHEGENFELGSRVGINQSRSIHHDTRLFDVRKSDAELEALN